MDPKVTGCQWFLKPLPITGPKILGANFDIDSGSTGWVINFPVSRDKQEVTGWFFNHSNFTEIRFKYETSFEPLGIYLAAFCVLFRSIVITLFVFGLFF